LSCCGVFPLMFPLEKIRPPRFSFFERLLSLTPLKAPSLHGGAFLFCVASSILCEFSTFGKPALGGTKGFFFSRWFRAPLRLRATSLLSRSLHYFFRRRDCTPDAPSSFRILLRVSRPVASFMTFFSVNRDGSPPPISFCPCPVPFSHIPLPPHRQKPLFFPCACSRNYPVRSVSASRVSPGFTESAVLCPFLRRTLSKAFGIAA